MKNIPDKIYIQIGNDVTVNDNFDFNELTGVSWCVDKIHKSDIIYVRKKKIVFPENIARACPFCGKKPKIKQGTVKGDFATTICCENNNCSVKPKMGTKTTAKFLNVFDYATCKINTIKIWNKRF